MTIKIYLSTHETSGIGVITRMGDDAGKPWIVLDRTWFHAQGGGQKADRGTLAGILVDHVGHGEDGEVKHYLAKTDGLQVGAQVEVVVDAAWRLSSARLHTAGHLIAVLGEELYPQLTALAGHHWPGEARVEFAGEPLPPKAELEQALSRALTSALEQGLPVTVCGDPLQNRSIQIGEHAAMPCGGTHLRSLTELGAVTIRGIKEKNGKLRIGYEVC